MGDVHYVTVTKAPSGDNSALITIWSDGKTPEQISAEIAARTGTATTKQRVLLIGWKQTPEVLAVLPKGSVSIATGVPRAIPTAC